MEVLYLRWLSLLKVENGDQYLIAQRRRIEVSAGGAASTLVFYDTAGPRTQAEAAEGEAIATSNLATHFGEVTAVPVENYSSGLIDDYDDVVYLGSVADQEVPTCLPVDIVNSDTPVVWLDANTSDLAADGPLLASSFEQTYGRGPLSSEESGSASLTGVL